eukprot:s1046_g5.t1
MNRARRAQVLADELADLRRRRAAKRAENRDLANQEKALKKRRSRLMQAARQLSTDDLVVLLQQQGTASEAGTQSVSANACCAADLSGGDRGEAIAVDDADWELGGSGLRQLRDWLFV